MRTTTCLLTLAVAISACTSPAPVKDQPPQGFPDLSAFTAVDPSKYDLGGRSFVSPKQVSCVLDHGPQKSIVCSGNNIKGMPENVKGSGCPIVHRLDETTSDTPYSFERVEPDCASSRFVSISAGQKLSGENGTCAVGENDLVACIDADMKHGFVLQPSGSWTF
jgi:hypothetical protein